MCSHGKTGNSKGAHNMREHMKNLFANVFA